MICVSYTDPSLIPEFYGHFCSCITKQYLLSAVEASTYCVRLTVSVINFYSYLNLLFGFPGQSPVLILLFLSNENYLLRKHASTISTVGSGSYWSNHGLRILVCFPLMQMTNCLCDREAQIMTPKH